MSMEFVMGNSLETLPKTIDFNFEELKGQLAESLALYTGLVVTEDGIKGAKEDRAKLNKLREALENKRKEVKRECMAPYTDFEAKVKELVGLIDQPIAAIDAQLKEYEEKILGAEERMLVIEQRIYSEIVAYVARTLPQLQRNAATIAGIDCLQSFARIACERHYVRPVLDEGRRIDIRQGRHPVIETLMPVGEQYVPNDVMLDDKEQQIMMITGPNMSGKSALLRQTALIVLMAQMGSFVPAESAHIGIVDKIFTRVGASDNISQGESTFMVEMLESASILNNISDRSLVLLDEIGRGTSTYDGISIAWAMVEYLHNHPTAHAKTLFATHYHELTELEGILPGVKNYSISIKKRGDELIFLRKIVPGAADDSYGIEVARLAGLPKKVTDRAKQLLAELEKAPKIQRELELRAEEESESQIDFEATGRQNVIAEIKNLDLDDMTPREAYAKLEELKAML